jgi:uncharacterized protein YqiB (DUF1249 family)
MKTQRPRENNLLLCLDPMKNGQPYMSWISGPQVSKRIYRDERVGEAQIY